MRKARTLLPALTVVAALAVLAATPVIAAELQLEDLQITAGDEPVVTIQLDDTAEGSAVSTFTLSGPDRLVIDIPDTRVNMAMRQITGDGAIIDRAEVTEFDDGNGYITRITLYLNWPAGTIQPQIMSEGRTVRVVLATTTTEDPMRPQASSSSSPATGPAVDAGAPRELSGPEAIPSGPAVTSLDFQNLDQVSRIVLGLQGTSDYSVTQPQPNLIVVDVPGAFLPQSLGRVLDTSEFLSPVRMVRAYRTSSGSRVAISLRRESSYTTSLGNGGLVYIDVAVPPQMQQDRAVARQGIDGVAPQAASRAGGEGVVITSGGRTLDSNYAYGPGANTSDQMGAFNAGSINFNQPTTATYTGRRISLDFVEADIHSIFRLISHVSRLNIVASDDVEGKVTVRMTDVPWDQALAAVLQAKGLGSQQFGNILRVAPIETIKSEQEARRAAIDAAFNTAELQVLVLPLNYVQASEMQEQVKELISERGSVQVDQAGNKLIIKDVEETIAQLRELVRVLDRQTPQVLIEARVVEANSNYARALGIQWGAEIDASGRTGYSTGAFFPSAVGAEGAIDREGNSAFYEPGLDSLMVDLGAEGANSGVAFSLGSIPGLINLDARLSAMESDGWGKVVSQPRVTTLDNRTATISQGQRIPFLSTSAGGTNVQFIEASLNLEVTPHITSDNKIFLAINVTNNRADFSQLVQGNPAIQIKEAATELLVDDGDTTVVGGVFSTEQSFSQDRVPGLSKIPLLGYLFKNSAEATTRNELLVFITPHIVTRPTLDGSGTAN